MIHYITTEGIGCAWVANELRQVENSGIPAQLWSMRKPRLELFTSEWARALNERTRVLYPLPASRLVLSIIAAPLIFGRRFFAALFNALFSTRESLRVRAVCLWHLFVACDWARRLRHEKVDLIHSQWIHSGGTIGMYAAWLLDVPFSFTGHAVDLFRDRAALTDKIRRAKFIICISRFHRQFYLKQGAKEEQLRIAYCGIDPESFSPGKRRRADGVPYRILGAGRLVEKKGFTYLIDACKQLAERGEEFECVVAGSGELEQELRSRAAQSGLADRVCITGEPLTQEQIPAFMHSGDLFCLPCVWSTANDVDGLPQLLMEAMACNLPVISTRLVGIPDLVTHEKSGLLVEPNDAGQLADAITRLMGDPELSDGLARTGRKHVLETFDIRTSLEPLLNEFRAVLGMPVIAPSVRSAEIPVTGGADT